MMFVINENVQRYPSLLFQWLFLIIYTVSTRMATAVPEPMDALAEWRVFLPLPTKLTSAVLGDAFDGAYDKRKGDGMVGRRDVYVSGLKGRMDF